MCGIAGQIAFPIADERAVRSMTNALAHRGPDGEGFLFDGPMALGHRRLSIIDVAGGAQPQFNEDKTIAVVFNGEIYNYKELFADLKSRHRFATVSDTEVLVHLYEERGEAMLEALRGMFAFAIWDKRRRRLFLARDRFGKKPIYFRDQGGVFTFASELGALCAAGGARGNIDREALARYLELLYIPAPRTIYQDCKKLPAGHHAVVDEKGVRITRYWHPPVPGTRAMKDRASARDVRALLADAVKMRLRSDVPLAALLSGGLDSTVVVGLMARELGPGVKTFSVGFGRADDELPFARAVARMHQTEHHEIVLTRGVVEQTTDALAAYSEPFGDSSAVPTVAVCREVAKQVKVVLTGDGGDELFAGYGRYRMVEAWPSWPVLKPLTAIADCAAGFPRINRARRALRLVSGTRVERWRALSEVFPAPERARLLGRDFGGVDVEAPAVNSDVDAALACDLAVYLPDDLLVKMDVASMRWGLEARSPFLDQDLAAVVVPQAHELKQDRTRGKLLLQDATNDLIPDEVRGRTKRGFGSPVDAWLRNELRDKVRDLVESPTSRVGGFFDRGVVARTVNGFYQGHGNGHQVWALLALESWARAFA